MLCTPITIFVVGVFLLDYIIASSDTYELLCILERNRRKEFLSKEWSDAIFGEIILRTVPNLSVEEGEKRTGTTADDQQVPELRVKINYRKGRK